MTSAAVFFGLVTDTHYGPTAYGNRDCPGALGRLRATLDAFAAAGVALVVNLGDAIDTAPTAAAELALCAEVRAAFDAFPGAVLHVIGNHDVAMLGKAEYLAAVGSRHPAYYSLDLHGMHLIILDGNCHEDGTDFDRGDFSWDDAWLSPAQIQWLEDDLAAAADRPTLLFCHECLDASTDDPHVLRNAPEIRRLLRRHPAVRAVFQGHFHPGRQTRIAGMPCHTLPALVAGAGGDPVGAIATVRTDGTVTLRAV
ncbi:MAG TPA: metallophosphoesterase [Armatimonadota bacterium]|nr:metallophosphoesterase [Armatimonadota bacterium]HOS42364.1 metallophosphoesterase [Armatimonadota bacterium]